MKENQKSEQVSNTLSNNKNQTGKNSQSTSQKSDSKSSKPTSAEDEKTTGGKELKDKNHEHEFKTPTARPSGKVGAQNEKSSPSSGKNRS